ncbi:hypothetical protein BGZ91_009652, partial [Linnemannia elongata]
FESTLVVAFPDVLMAGPKILLSAAPHADSIPAWSHFCTTPEPTHKRSTATSTSLASQKKKRALEANAIRYSTVPGGRIGLLTIAVAPPTNEQSSYLCEAIVKQARASGTERIVLVAASNFASKVQDTHIVQLHQEGQLGFTAIPKDAIIENLTRALGVVVGDQTSSVFSADKAFDYNTSTAEEEASTESMMYL